MTLQWSFVAWILYIEIAVCLILLIPWINPLFWLKLYNTSIIRKIKTWLNIYSYAGGTILIFLFMDAIREMRRLGNVLRVPENEQRFESYALEHMRLFHSQRNFYITGFSLILFVGRQLCGWEEVG